MTWSETPNNDLNLSTEPSKNIPLVKNAEGKRVESLLIFDDEENKNLWLTPHRIHKEIGVVVIDIGHIWHAYGFLHAQAEKILDILNTSNIGNINDRARIILMENDDMHWYLWTNASLQEIAKTLLQKQIIIEPLPLRDMEDIIHLEKNKSYPSFKKQYPAPKPQKSKAKQIKGYRQKNK